MIPFFIFLASVILFVLLFVSFAHTICEGPVHGVLPAMWRSILRCFGFKYVIAMNVSEEQVKMVRRYRKQPAIKFSIGDYIVLRENGDIVRTPLTPHFARGWRPYDISFRKELREKIIDWLTPITIPNFTHPDKARDE